MSSQKYKYTCGATFAYDRFVLNFRRINSLLEVGLFGLSNRLGMIEEIIQKLDNPVFEESARDKEKKLERVQDDKYVLHLTEKEISVVNEAMEYSHKEHSILDSYLYSILIVYIWGLFETYFSMLFEELFTMKPELLKSKDVINFDDLISNIDNPIKLLIERELNKVGHFKIKDLLVYLQNKLNFEIEVVNEKKLKELYLTRNIIAHNTGIIRSDIRKEVPKELVSDNGEITISKEYLEMAMEVIL
ncbi:hypothetical protein [Paenibacillus polymyxa]|uniref:hypothetical protein n=1 Tax=Paenibacillus polymyxa TaxID=1406 RepID=UPI003F830A56